MEKLLLLISAVGVAGFFIMGIRLSIRSVGS
jgi:hypothetical protein